MDSLLLKKLVETALLTAHRPLSLGELLGMFDPEELITKKTLLAVLEQLQPEAQLRGLELSEVASGWRYQAEASLSPWLDRLRAERPAKYSRALMETLALIAYRQPITRAEIEEIRGVTVSSVIIRTLQEREWVKIAGYRQVPGKPALFITTRQFLDDFNLVSLAQLPALLSFEASEQEANVNGNSHV